VPRTAELRQQTERVLARKLTLSGRPLPPPGASDGPPRAARDRLPGPEYTRLLARLETMPAIEQAKGIIMAQSTAVKPRHSTCCGGPPNGPTCQRVTWQSA
jgi:hypothetical protein